MDSQEIGEQLAYDSLEPPEDGYWQAAMIATVIANANRGRNTRAFTVEDFLPRPAGPPRINTDEENLQAMQRFAFAWAHAERRT